ncbi:MAG: hypothetical protein US89_C0014G0005 [Candidatus Peregrinibacteria bacterium GW2011_GWF2_38_29]|nr:MAG: hypothetical protein US89_C0014G0005 [Candidatus Peregrinibacteria bacterium GW2011_GWF2_38_29]
MKKQKPSRSFRVPFGVIITVFIMAVIALSFVVKPEFVKGLIVSITTGLR